MAQILDRLAGGRLKVLQFGQQVVDFIVFDELAAVVKAHGDQRDLLGRSVVQIASEFLARFLLDLDQAVALLAQVGVEDGILDRHSNLRADGGQQGRLIGREGVRLRAAEDQHAVILVAHAQRDEHERTGAVHGYKVDQFRVFISIGGKNGLGALERLCQQAFLARQHEGLIARRQATRADHVQLIVIAEEQDGAGQAGVGGAHAQAEQANIHGDVERLFVI